MIPVQEEKAKVTVHFKNVWAPGGVAVATVATRAIQNEVEVANKPADYVPGPFITVSYGGEVPNGDTRFVARALDANGQQVGEEVAVDVSVDKTLIQVPSHITVE